MYAGNNPVLFIDPDGAQVLAPLLAGSSSVMLGSSSTMVTAGNSWQMARTVGQNTARFSRNFYRNTNAKETANRFSKQEFQPIKEIVKPTVAGEFGKWAAEGLDALIGAEIARRMVFDQETKTDATSTPIPNETSIKKP